MKTGRILLVPGLLLLLSVGFGSAALASGGSPWQTHLYLNILGIGLAAEYDDLSLFPDTRGGLYVSLCGTYEDWGFYRNPDGSPYPPGGGGSDPGRYKRMDYVWSVGWTQGLIADETGANLVEAFIFYKGRDDENLPGESPAGSLIFLSGLPDRGGIRQTSFLIGVAYDNMREDEALWAKSGYRAELSLEWAPEGLNDCAEFQCLNMTLTGFWPVWEGERVHIYAGDRLIYDRLSGDYIPISARTSFGGLGIFPGRQEAGLGDVLRGIQLGRFDGYTKAVNNLELRATFPGLLGEKFTLGAVAYYDLGVSDQCTGTIDWGSMYSSVGVGAALHTWLDLDLVAYADYFLNEELFTVTVEFGRHF